MSAARAAQCRRGQGLLPVMPGIFPSLRSSSGLGLRFLACPDSVYPGFAGRTGDRGGLPRVRRGVSAADGVAGSPSTVRAGEDGLNLLFKPCFLGCPELLVLSRRGVVT
jgi:hypothetical protein